MKVECVTVNVILWSYKSKSLNDLFNIRIGGESRKGIDLKEGSATTKESFSGGIILPKCFDIHIDSRIQGLWPEGHHRRSTRSQRGQIQHVIPRPCSLSDNFSYLHQANKEISEQQTLWKQNFQQTTRGIVILHFIHILHSCKHLFY